jgi:hypothetical protein
MRGRGGGVFALKIPGDGPAGPLQVKGEESPDVSRSGGESRNPTGSRGHLDLFHLYYFCKIEFLNRGVKWTSF